MPIRITPCALSLGHSCARKGASCWQGSHHEAQKFKMIGWPFKSARWIVLVEPLSAGSVKSTIGFPLRGKLVTSPLSVVLLLALFAALLFCCAGVSNCVQSSISKATFKTLTRINIVMLRLRERLRAGEVANATSF